MQGKLTNSSFCFSRSQSTPCKSKEVPAPRLEALCCTNSLHNRINGWMILRFHPVDSRFIFSRSHKLSVRQEKYSSAKDSMPCSQIDGSSLYAWTRLDDHIHRRRHELHSYSQPVCFRDLRQEFAKVTVRLRRGKAWRRDVELGARANYRLGALRPGLHYINSMKWCR